MATPSIADLTQKITDLEASLASSVTTAAEQTARIAELESHNALEVAKVAQRDADIATKAGELSAATAKVTDLDSKLTAENAKTAKLTTDLAIAREVSARFTGAAPARNDYAKGEQAKTITRAEFDALPAHEQAAHCKNGGKITD